MHKAALVGIQKINRLFLWFNWLFLSAVNKNNLKQIYVRLGKEKIKKTDIYCFTLTPRAKCNPQKPLVIHYAIKTRFQTPHTKVVTLNPSCTLMGWGRLGPRERVGTTLPCFSVSSPSATIWATALCLISLKLLGRLLMSDSLKGPYMIPFLKACTIMSSSLVVLQRPSLVLPYVEKIVRDWRRSPIGYVLLPKQHRKLRKRRHMRVREADEPV